MSAALWVVWIALLGADRIDLLAGFGPFLLTPFLLLTPLLLLVEALRVLRARGAFWRPHGALGYFVVVAALLAVFLLSVGFSDDLTKSVPRVALVTVQIVGTMLAALAIANRPDTAQLLRRGAYAGVAVALLFNALQLFALASGVESLGGVIVIEPRYYGFIPRLSAQALDMNRGGVLILIYLLLLLTFARPSRWRAAAFLLGGVSLVMTLSRSVMLGALATTAVLLLRRARLRVSPGALFGGVAAAAVLLVALLASPAANRALAEVAEPLTGRFSTEEGSASEHVQLLERAWEVSTDGPREFLLGIGFGNAYTVLQDIYPGEEYANFHSLYVTVLAESGVVALVLMLALLVVPVLRGGPYRPLIVGLIFFNLFYQMIAEPAFWFVLAAAWMGLGASVPQAARPPRAGIEPERAAAPLPS